MSQSLSKVLVHLIFSTKHRTPRITPDIQPALHRYLGGIFRQWQSPALRIGGVEDHIHALFLLSKNYALAKIVQEVKSGSSTWIKTQGQEFCGFHWQNGYGAFSIPANAVDFVCNYIGRQEAHHRTESFKTEFRRIMREHGIEIDERYVWD